jgi:glycosyltransferase involved in cell wall biosynthesis
MKKLKNNIVVVFSSHLGDEVNNEFVNHIHKTIGVKHKIVCYPNYNQFSLSEIYNNAINEHSNESTIMVFCHPDIIYKTLNWGKVLLNHFNHTDFGIIGVAGSTFIGKNSWWEDRSKMVGIVWHSDKLSTWVSEYSNEFNGVKPTVNVDGLFMAVDCDKIVCKFNLNYGKFHFYDLSFCLPNYLEGCNIGVTTSIRILHKSVGQTNQEWEINRQKFVEEYKEDLPIKHVSEDKLKVLICCQFFKNYTGSEVSNYELSKELVKLGCDVTLISSMVGNPLYEKAIKNGVKVYSFTNLPNYIIDQEGKFQFVKNEAEFDIIHINHKPIGELILQLYPNTPAVMHVRSEVIPVFEEPIINPNIKRYISIRESITEFIKSFGISDDNIIEIDNPFDIKRFNTNYKQQKNSKEVVLFIGTLDYLRKKILNDLGEMTNANNQELWIIGADNENYAEDLIQFKHIKYLGVKSNVEEYIKKCDYTAGIFKGRTTIEGFLCGKSGWVYTVDKQGNILNKELQSVPDDIQKYSSEFSANKVFSLYKEILNET